ncbi:hypothetical protein EU245_14785 [Lentibacillus lipolyticus]|nr:hypothetical protein EU245_14785 [Lentibacillus lipolyticus]
MKFKRERNVFQPPAEGNYLVAVAGWKEGKQKNTIMGLTPSAVVTFDLGNGQKVMQSMLVYSGGNSLVEKLFDAILGEDADDVHFDELIGKECGIEVKHNHVGEVTYANVVDVFPVSAFENEEGEEDEEQEDPFEDIDFDQI